MSTRTANRVKVNTGSKKTASKPAKSKPAAKRQTKKQETQSSVTLRFDREKETPGTIRFKERPADDDSVAVGTLYIKKPVDALLGSPAALTVTVEVGA